MGRKSKLRQLRRLQKGNTVLDLNYLTCSKPTEVYQLLFQHSNAFAMSVWTYWRQCYAANHPQFMIFESEASNHPESRMTIRPGDELKQWGQPFNMLPRDLDLRGCIVVPDELERLRIPPPTMVILHDGKPDGECVAQFLRFKYS